MAITTLEKVKEVNGITNTNYDTQITSQIPVVAQLILDYTNDLFLSTTPVAVDSLNRRDIERERFFEREDVERGSKGFVIFDDPSVSAYGAFTIDSTAKTITSTSDSFTDFATDDDIYINRSYRNDGYYTIATVTDTVITVQEDIKDGDDNIIIYLVDYPLSISNIAARMIGWDVLKRNKTAGMDTERIGTYSYKLQEIGGMGYPQDIANALKSYKLGRGK